jgi:hypothetical protein
LIHIYNLIRCSQHTIHIHKWRGDKSSYINVDASFTISKQKSILTTDQKNACHFSTKLPNNLFSITKRHEQNMTSNRFLRGSVIGSVEYDRYDSISFLGATSLFQTNRIRFDTRHVLGLVQTVRGYPAWNCCPWLNIGITEESSCFFLTYGSCATLLTLHCHSMTSVSDALPAQASHPEVFQWCMPAILSPTFSEPALCTVKKKIP